MPIYTVACSSCGQRDSIFRKIDDRDTALPVCCEMQMGRILDKPFIQPDISSYISPGTGKLVSSRAERRRDLQEARAIEWEPGIERDVARRKAELQAEAFKPISDAVDTIVREMNVTGKLETSHA